MPKDYATDRFSRRHLKVKMRNKFWQKTLPTRLQILVLRNSFFSFIHLGEDPGKVGFLVSYKLIPRSQQTSNSSQNSSQFRTIEFTNSQHEVLREFPFFLLKLQDRL